MSLRAPSHDWNTESSAPAIAFRQVSARYSGSSEGALAIDSLSLEILAGELCAVLGPNGAGKSTLVRLLSGLLRPAAGTVAVLGDDIGTLDRRAIAGRIAVVPQHIEVALGFAVREVVAMGRAPHQGAWMRASPKDDEAVARALASCELEALADRPVAELSGGEQKRVAVARALAQEAPILLLDEAGAHLDVRHAIAMHELVRREVAERGLACLAVLHDLNAAAQYADRVALLKAGRLLAHGTVEEVMTYRRLKEAFETELYVGVNELDDARYFLPVRPRSRPSGGRDL
jgi:iron complex transport system ATP-binding protein